MSITSEPAYIAPSPLGEPRLFPSPLCQPARFVQDVLRNDTPEEHVRQRIARSLVEEYGYDRRDIHIEFPIKLGSGGRSVDIAIFPPGQIHKQENISSLSRPNGRILVPEYERILLLNSQSLFRNP